MTRADLRASRWAWVLALALAALGALVVALGDSTALTAIGMTVLGSAGVVAVAGLFYAIGRSEDRERSGDGHR